MRTSPKRQRAPLLKFILLAGLGATLGLSQVFHGFYDETTWGPIALATLVLLLALATGTPRRIPLAAVLARWDLPSGR